jgi:hypothetical protein
MINRLRSLGLAGGGGLFLVLTLSGVVAAASVLNVLGAPVVDPTEPAVVDTTATFEDLNGDGIDDDCQTAVTEDTDAALATKTAADLNGDGQISVSEAAQTDWTGGTNCNHGGYVSQVAGCDDAAPADATETGDESGEDAADETGGETVPVVAVTTTTTTETATCTEDPADAENTADTTAPVVCEAPVAPVAPVDATTTTVVTEPTVEVLPNDHGKKVNAVAQDKAAIGGKNCNHGGAVSEVANDHAARDAAKAAAKEARAAAKEARAAERAAAKAERAAQHATKTHGKSHNH